MLRRALSVSFTTRPRLLSRTTQLSTAPWPRFINLGLAVNKTGKLRLWSLHFDITFRTMASRDIKDDAKENQGEAPSNSKEVSKESEKTAPSDSKKVSKESGNTAASDTKEVKKESGNMASSDSKDGTEESHSAPYATRKSHNLRRQKEEDVKKIKEEFLALKLSDKRKLYKCRDKYTTLGMVETWPEYYAKHLAENPKLEKWWSMNQKDVAFEVNSDLNKKISLFGGDITTLEIDSIANAANESLLGGGGVDGAIHAAAGRKGYLRNECELLGGCRAGDAKITCGYNLPAKYVVHTVGPRGERPETLASCYKKSLDLVKENNLTAIAFPCISTGVFGYPNLNAAKVALQTIREWLEKEDYAKNIDRIIMCLFMQKDIDIYHEQMQLYFPLDRGASK